MVDVELARGADILIINKFGKHEADGRGFRPVIAEALSNGIPVLVGINALNFDAFQSFVGVEVAKLDTTKAALLDWVSGLCTDG